MTIPSALTSVHPDYAVASHPSNSSKSNIWVADSGATHHICNNRKLFLEGSLIKMRYPFPISLGDNSVITLTHSGTVRLHGEDIECLFAPQFRISLLSIPQLDNAGMKTFIGGGICSILGRTGLPIWDCHLDKNLYVVKRSPNACILVVTRTGSRKLANASEIPEQASHPQVEEDIGPAVDV